MLAKNTTKQRAFGIRISN